jgi:endoglucanase
MNATLTLSALVLAAAAAPVERPTPLRLTETEYLAAPDLSVLAFHNLYPVGYQGGIEIIQHDERIATNGDVVIRRVAQDRGPRVQAEPIPRIDRPRRLVDRDRQTITIPFDYPDVAYRIRIAPEAAGFAVAVDLEKPLDPAVIEKLSFRLALYPGAYRGKTFATETDFGVLPFDFVGEVAKDGAAIESVPLASGQRLTLAAEDPLLRMEITSDSGPLRLVDSRGEGLIGWFTLVAEPRAGATTDAIRLHFRPNRVAGWRRNPVIAHSQVGYHTKESKRAILELDPRTTVFEEAKLLRVASDGTVTTALAERPKPWGPFLRYEYAVFDFTSVDIPGLYRLAYGPTTTAPFRIAEDVYAKGVWQPAIETFLPVQMCHMSVKDRGRLWHGACHLDDGLQVPAPKKFFDGYEQKDTTDSPFAPDTTIPGLNVGGWHDAGDDDINTGSSGRTAYHLALIALEFGATSDQTTVDFASREVQLHRPDGKPDILQQLEQGVRWLLAPYRVMDHSVVGVISHDWDAYLQSGDWAQQSDGLFYDAKLGPRERTATHSGRPDDRYVFTNKDSSSEYFVAGTLAASSRALRSFDPGLSEECLATARRIWRQEEGQTPVAYHSVGTPESLLEERTNAAVELYLATRETAFLESAIRDRAPVLDEIARTGWTLSRVVDDLPDATFRQAFEARVSEYSKTLAERFSKNPFGTYLDAHVWGFSWDILWQVYKHYFLIKRYPALFPKEQLTDAVEFTLGRHPGSDLSLVSSVGAHRPIPAFGVNRADYGHIPGGIYSGVEIIDPDFPEMKDDHPYLWQQSEYIVFGATPYAFCVLAADRLLGGPHSQ